MTTEIETVRIRCGSDVATMRWMPAKAWAHIILDGVETQWETADARHDTARAVELCVPLAWGDGVDMDAVEWEVEG